MDIFASRRLSDDNPSNDDATNNFEDTNGLISTLTANSIIFGALFIFFEINRHIKPIYLKRLNSKFIQSQRVPPEPPKYFLGWIFAISGIDDDEILRMIGLDGYMLLRYILLCFRFSLFISFWGLVVLAPIYKSAGTYVGWNQFTLANVPNNPKSRELWAPAIFAYVFSGYFCFLLHSEYKNFVQKRIDYLIKGDLDTPPQTYYTILIEKIPASLRSEPVLRDFFDKIFPGEIYSVEIALDLNELDNLVSKRHKVRDKLEKAIALWNATGKRPTAWQPSNDSTLSSHAYSTTCHSVKKSEVARMLGYTVVDSVDYYTILLNELNDAVGKLQERYYQQRRQNDSTVIDANSHVQGRLEAKTLSVLNKANNKTGGVLDSVINVFKGDREPLISDESHSKSDSLLENDSLGQLDNTGVRDSASSTSSNPSDKRSLNNNNQVMEFGSKFVTVAGSGVDSLAKEGYKTAKIATKGALRGVLEATRALELLTVGAYYSTSSTGFITMNSRVAASCASQMLISQKYFQIQIKSAPNPKDIIWDNVSIPQQQINIRHRIADNTLIVGALFWSVVVGFIATIGNLDSLSQQYSWIQLYSNTTFYKFLNSYLAVGILLILISLLPFIFDIIARNYEGLKLESEIQNSIMSRYFYYLIANVFVSVGLGSLASSLHQIIESPQSILSIIGNSVPNLSIYFTNLVIVRTLTAIPIEMLRIWPLIQVLSVTSCIDKKKCTRRELQTGAFADPVMVYGWIYPSIMMILMIMVTYSCIAPFLAPFCAVFFGFAFLMYKYQLLYVYINDYQSGGFMWYAVFSRSLVCLCGGIVTLICYLGIRETFFSGPFYLVLPLPIAIIFFMYHCEGKFKPPSEKLSLESSIDLDKASSVRRANNKRTANDTFKETMFRQPSLAEGKVSPLPYRKHKISSDEGTTSPLHNNKRALWDFMEPTSPAIPVNDSPAKPLVEFKDGERFDKTNLLVISKQDSFIEDYIDHYEAFEEVEHEKANQNDVEINEILDPSYTYSPTRDNGTNVSIQGSSGFVPPNVTTPVRPQESVAMQDEVRSSRESSPIVESTVPRYGSIPPHLRNV